MEGFIEEDPSDPTKVLILFLDSETGGSVRGRIGQDKPDAGFTVIDFKVVREMVDGGIHKIAKATVLDTRLGKEIVLTDAEPRYDDAITMVNRFNRRPKSDAGIH